MKYQGTVTGMFEEVQTVEAASEKEATLLLQANRGDTIQRTALDVLEVSRLEALPDFDEQ